MRLAAHGVRTREPEERRAVKRALVQPHVSGAQMPANAPVLVTRAHVGKGPGIVLVSFAAPAGELGKGTVENVEVMRIAMTHATFKEFAGLFNYTLGELGIGQPVPSPNASDEPTPRRFERRSRSVPAKT
jgi:hypothetical protein